MEAGTSTAPSPEARAANKHRFEFELEFVQSLANPHYLQSLAQQNVLVDPSFVLYLKYLLYWTDPEYARFVVYPHALHHLQLLQNEKFREALKNSDTAQWLSEKQFDHWRTWRAGPVPTVPHTNFLPKSLTNPESGTAAIDQSGTVQPNESLSTNAQAGPSHSQSASANHNHTALTPSRGTTAGTPRNATGVRNPTSNTPLPVAASPRGLSGSP
ncbi:SOH1-domain-containing protein [Cantharellus anzutake]|uniref:SOH1-domain-containing protein n=1 Tax=Cantharellus anzutake TaxID=1750568 RepID=UPI0019072BB1|nr:SOH1-domain-containing protein [Cantharellus anzutake]KAF8332629.1 SOH1-domain-containing protein [Cantharellus anzutake]